QNNRAQLVPHFSTRFAKHPNLFSCFIPPMLPIRELHSIKRLNYYNRLPYNFTLVKLIYIMITLVFLMQRMTTMNRYEIFMKVIEKGSFTKAAEDFGYTQSAVSQMIKTLEDELSTTLISRSRKGISLTPDGKEFFPFIS